MRVGRRSTTSCSAPCSSAAAQAAIAAAERVGGRILEVGVGTGISLPDYSDENQLCGVDISEPMLRKARERVAGARPSPMSKGLAVMDAEQHRFSRRLVRRGDGAIRRHHRAESRGDAR